ncbi:hypothetical protein Bbelb_168050 [Branchiostoma belcheri]|nr:hypothetical protein Bbelb_168050 [Branchiostoma belcheri]
MFVLAGVVSGELPQCPAGQQLCFSDDYELATCYNPEYERCCDGTPIVRRYGESCAGPDMKLCGSTPYNWTSGELDCCGDEVYNRRLSWCCRDGYRSVKHPRKEGFFCCGTEYIDGTTDSCCTTKYHHKHPKSYKFKNFMCCATQHHTQVSKWMTEEDIEERMCCGLNIMYKKEERDPYTTCCNDEVVKRTVGQGCCADRGLFDNSTHVCCEGKETVKRSECCQGQVHSPEEGRTACCKGKAYNPDTHSCCQDTVVTGTGQCCGKTVMDPHTDSCCQDTVEQDASVPQTSPHHGCCGLSSMNNQTHTCCARTAVPREAGKACCGKTTYNLTSELCCGPNHDVIQTKVTDKTQCCGAGTFESGEENCCVGRRNSIRILAGRECCRTEDGEYQGYDPGNATCCGSQVHDGVPKSKNMCCGGTMRTDQQLCCEDNRKNYKVLTKRGQEDKCCLNHDTNDISLYNSNDMVCQHGKLSFIHKGWMLCGGKDYDPGDNSDRKCCGYSTHAYSPSFQSCCSGRVKDDPEQIWGCCKGVFYHKNTHDCSGSDDHGEQLVLYAGGEAEAPTDAAPAPTSPAEETITCAGVTYGRWSDDGRERRCCSKRRFVAAYFPHNQTCCGDKVFDLPDDTARCCRDVAYDNTTHCCVNQKVTNCTDQPPPATPTHPREQISCSGYKHDRYDDQGNERVCCPRGTNSYSPATQKCCGNRVADIPSSRAGCCNRVPYSKDKHRCFQRRRLIPLPQPTSPPTETVQKTSPQQPEEDKSVTPGSTNPPSTPTKPTTNPSTPTPPWKPNYHVCGGKEYDPTTYICHKNKKYFKDKFAVCSGNLIITRKEKCCEGRIRKIRKRKTECCGKRLVNPKRMDCVNNKPVKSTESCGECGIKFKRRLDWKFPKCSKANIFSAKVEMEFPPPLNGNMTTLILTNIDDGTARTKGQSNTNNKPLQSYMYLTMQVHRCQCPTFRIGKTYLFLTDSDVASSGEFTYDPVKDVVTRFDFKRMFIIKKLYKRGKCSQYGKAYHPTV